MKGLYLLSIRVAFTLPSPAMRSGIMTKTPLNLSGSEVFLYLHIHS